MVLLRSSWSTPFMLYPLWWILHLRPLLCLPRVHDPCRIHWYCIYIECQFFHSFRDVFIICTSLLVQEEPRDIPELSYHVPKAVELSFVYSRMLGVAYNARCQFSWARCHPSSRGARIILNCGLGGDSTSPAQFVCSKDIAASTDVFGFSRQIFKVDDSFIRMNGFIHSDEWISLLRCDLWTGRRLVGRVIIS